MYTELKSYQIILSLLKKYNIRHCVLSAGSRNVPFVHSVEEDPFFECYSVVDERSAGYFALGLSQQLHVPVVLSCTSSTATCNYWPPVAEAFYQGVPLLVLTSDRDPAQLGQWEDQMIDQVGMYDRHVRKSVNLPVVNNNNDFHFCQRLVNEALLELFHHNSGPVHINIPMVSYNVSFNQKELVNAVKYDRLEFCRDQEAWTGKKKKLKECKRVLVISGQNSYVPESLKQGIQKFFEQYNCSLAFDHLANIDNPNAWNPCVCMDGRYVTNAKFKELMPDIIISFGYNMFSSMKEIFRKFEGSFEHWLINPDGTVIDAFKGLTTIFECHPEEFFEYMTRDNDARNDGEYNKMLTDYCNSVKYPEFEYSNIYAIKNVVERIPSGSILNLSINDAIRITNFFKLQPNVKTYANIGTHGIDGCLSSLLGQSMGTDALSFMVIGDLSFFYDMNALRIKHIKKNVRILLLNNHGGEEFYYNGIWRNENSDLHTTARHNTKAEGWVKECGFKYLSAYDKESYDAVLPEFMDEQSEQPILFEVFSEMSEDAKKIYEFYDLSRPKDIKSEVMRRSKDLVRATIGSDKAKKIAEAFNIKL